MSEAADKPVRITLTKSQLSTFRGRELFKILSEISADGILSNAEIEQLRVWLSADTKDKLPAESHLSQLLTLMLANGQVSVSERAQLQKEIERILPPSQRMEAKAARKHIEDLLDTRGDSESSENTGTTEPENAALSRLEAKQKAQHNALLAAVKANAARPLSEGQKQYDIKLPGRRPYEPRATLKQKDLLWAMGVKDEALLEALGKWQASALIDQIKAQSGSKNGCAALIILGFGVLLIGGCVALQS